MENEESVGDVTSQENEVVDPNFEPDAIASGKSIGLAKKRMLINMLRVGAAELKAKKKRRIANKLARKKRKRRN